MYFQFANGENVNVLQSTQNFPAQTTRDIMENSNENVTDTKTEESTNAKLKKNKKKRNFLTGAQCTILEKEFAMRAYIDRFRRNELADELNVSSLQLRTWFRNRRIKEMKKLKINQCQAKVEKSATASTDHQTEVAIPLMTTNQQPELLDNPKRSTFGTLSYSICGNVADQMMNDCGNLDHDFSCCTKLNFQPLKTPYASSYIGPLYDMSAPYMTSSFDYEYDFFNDYS